MSATRILRPLDSFRLVGTRRIPGRTRKHLQPQQQQQQGLFLSSFSIQGRPQLQSRPQSYFSKAASGPSQSRSGFQPALFHVRFASSGSRAFGTTNTPGAHGSGTACGAATRGINGMDNMDNMDYKWGFVVYRTVYESEPGPDPLSKEDRRKDSETTWEAAKERIARLAIEDQRERILENEGDPDSAVLLFVEDEALLGGKSVAEVRRIFNPKYDPDSDEPPDPRPDNLCETVCLAVDAGSLRSILSGDQTPYVIAVDATTETSEQFTTAPGRPDLVPVPWDGSMKVEVADIFSVLYLRGIGEGAISMAEVHPDAGEIWEGI